MKSKILCLGLTITLGSVTGCADNIDRFMNNYPGVKGKPVSALVEAIGTPDAETTVMNKKVYTWGNQSYGTTLRPVMHNTTFSGPGGTVYGSGTSYVTEDYDLACTFKVIVDKKDIVREANYSGAPGACAKYGPGLERLVNPAAAKASP
jgi:hypothetical protein